MTKNWPAPTTRKSTPWTAAAWTRRVATRILGTAFAVVLRLVDLTWRRDPTALGQLDRLIATGRPILAVFWHGKYVPLFSVMAGRKATAFTSSSFRGTIVSEICRFFGYDTVLLPDGGRERSRDLVRQALNVRQIGAFAIDGPVGPYHVVKPGAIELAAERGGWLVPVTVASGRKAVLHNRWDKMEIPHLFTRLVVAIGEPVEVPAGIGGKALAQMREDLRQVLEALDARAETAAAEGLPLVDPALGQADRA